MTIWIFTDTVRAARVFIANHKIPYPTAIDGTDKHNVRMVSNVSSILGEGVRSTDMIFYSSDFRGGSEFKKLFNKMNEREPGLIPACELNGERWLEDWKVATDNIQRFLEWIRAENDWKFRTLAKERAENGSFASFEDDEGCKSDAAWYPDDPDYLHLTTYQVQGCCGDEEQVDRIPISALDDFLQEIASRRK